MSVVYALKRLVIVGLVLLTGQAMAFEKSSSLIFSEDRSQIISANFDAGSVSILDRASGSLLKEARIGRDIRRIALSIDQDNKNAFRILATDYLADQLILLDGRSLNVIKRIDVPSRPFGAVYDQRNNQFYVTSFEQDKLLVVNVEGKITSELKTASTPRGLALTKDSRLLVTHALSGEVSVYDVATSEPRLQRIIQLVDTPFHPKQTTPQGKPRLLDNIVISPDGNTAWLPHVLWSFGHDFQFQSTVFPTVSIIDLEVGNEHERVTARKQLFKQINVVENGNKTRIVSNPHDVTFTADGKKVLVTLAGSEDLMVFDLSRGQGRKGNKKRHRRKKFHGGAKVTQIYRNVPGNNPKGIISTGRDVFVQNAMTLDLVKFDAGKPGPFSKIKLAEAHFASLVAEDPLSPQMRLGKTLFNNANEADYPGLSMAGDFWMSCNSCHLDGFNFTNRQLMADGKKNRFENAITGHVDTHKMIAGDPITAYLDIIQKTQGGMMDVALDQPPLEAIKMMSALNEYVRAPENLPYLSTWLRLDDDQRYTHPEEWVNSAKCADCHTTIYDQWADSNHGMNMDHPFYRFQEDIAAKEEGEAFRTLCRGCHAPQAIINNKPEVFSEFGDMYEKNGHSLKTALEQHRPVNERGTGCLFCHRITKAENSGGNTDLTVNLKDRPAYVFEDSANPVMEWLADRQINAQPKAHRDSYSNPELYQSSLYCATCHNEFTTGMGANINDNFGEWLASPFNRPDDAQQHKTCIDCHMTEDATHFNSVAGQSTNDGPVKPNLRSHHFVGGNYYFTGMRNSEHKKLSIDILKTALTLDVEKQGRKFIVKVTNKNSGHHMPGGARRQVWLEVIATDAQGAVVYQSGVMNQGVIPADARRFIKIGVDKDGVPVGLRFWRYVKIGLDTRIPSGETRQETFDLPEGVQYPLTVSTRVLYQVFAKKLTDQVRAAFPDENIPEPEVIELIRRTAVFEAQ